MRPVCQTVYVALSLNEKIEMAKNRKKPVVIDEHPIEAPNCLDCGVEYGTLGLDIVLPDQQWKAICPEDGILCANCICKRAEQFGGTAILVWVNDIDYAMVPNHWQNKGEG